jgi:uncharacterized protein YndB with AHSA1/START domain
MNNTEFVYTTYIKTTPEKLWKAITTPEFTRQYWADGIVSDWKKGSTWKHAAGAYIMGGEVLESDPPRRLVITWAEPGDGTNIARHSRVAFEIEAIGDMVRLNVVHNDLLPGSVMAGKISVGWPRVLSSLKSLLETGAALDTWAGLQLASVSVNQGA